MASSSSSSPSSMIFLFVLLLAIFIGLLQPFYLVAQKGWIVPPPNDTNTYNHWASNNRFQKCELHASNVDLIQGVIRLSDG
ncbi:hypothetical protein Lal_00005832 [Lupinus albus]|nr:hypothetical protein Lal_00005832 [Lupinus albus]